jgi:hypothetical protein
MAISCERYNELPVSKKKKKDKKLVDQRRIIKVAVERVELLFCILKIAVQILARRQAITTEDIRGFPHALKQNSETLFHITLRQLPINLTLYTLNYSKHHQVNDK